MTYFSVIPIDLFGLLIPNLSVRDFLILNQIDPFILQKLESNPFLLSYINNTIGINLSTKKQKQTFRKILCFLKYGNNKPLLSLAIEMNSVGLMEFVLSNYSENIKSTYSDIGLQLGKLGDQRMIDAIVDFYPPFADEEVMRSLKRYIAIGAAKNGHIDILAKYLDHKFINVDDAFKEAMISENLMALKYLSRRYVVSRDLVINSLAAWDQYQNNKNYKLLDWLFDDPAIVVATNDTLRTHPYVRELILKRNSAIGTVGEIAYTIRQGAKDLFKALDVAAEYGREDILEYLLDNFKFEERYLSHAINEAARSKLPFEIQKRVIEFLLQHGGKTNGVMAISLATGAGNIEIIRFLLPYVDRGYGMAIFVALNVGHCEIADLIYQHAKSKGHQFDNYVKDKIYDTVRSGNLECLRWVIKYFGVPPQNKIEKLMKEATKHCNQEMIDYVAQFQE